MPQAGGTDAFSQALPPLPTQCPLALVTGSLQSSRHISTASWASRAGFCPRTKSSGCWDNGSKSHASSRPFSQMVSLFPASLTRPLKNGGGGDQLRKTPSEEVLNLPHRELIPQQPALPKRSGGHAHSKHFPSAYRGQAPSKLDHTAPAREGTAGADRCDSRHVSPRAGPARKVPAAGGRGICVRVKRKGDSCTGWKVRRRRIPRVLSTLKI